MVILKHNLFINILKLLRYFIKTEIVGFIELLLWIKFHNLLLHYMIPENDIFSIGLAIAFATLIIPLLCGLHDYQQNQEEIRKILKEF